MDCERAKVSGDLPRPPSIHSLKSALKSLSLPSVPPIAPLPPLPTTPCSASTSLSGPSTPRKASFTSLSLRPNKPIKYGTGRYSHVELVPQPSDDLDDPLNWSQRKKDFNLASLFVMVALVGVLKTIFVATNSAMAAHYSVSYASIAALTAVPMMVSTFSGMLSSVCAKLCGKRPVYLVSSILVFTGCVWNSQSENSYGSCLGARILQGLGWGAFDSLVMETIQDTYFEHERNIRVSLYSIFSITMTWGCPLAGGVISYAHGSFTFQYRILSGLFVMAFPLLAFGAPETAFNRSRAAIATTPTSDLVYSNPWRPHRIHRKLSKSTMMDYIKEMKPFSYKGDLSTSTISQTPRALAAPTTILVFLLTVIPHCALWGLATSLALILSPTPLNLTSDRLGTLLAGPWILAIFLIVCLYLYRSVHQKFTRCASNLIIVGGTILAILGLLSFGLSINSFMLTSISQHGSIYNFFVPETTTELSLPLLSFQLGLLAAGSSALDATTRALLARSASFTASSMAIAQRSIGDMHICVVILRNLLAGVFVIAMPHVIALIGGLKALAIGLSIAQAVITLGVVILWYFCNEAIWRIDGKVMGLVDLRILKMSGSFFDTD